MKNSNLSISPSTEKSSGNESPSHGRNTVTHWIPSIIALVPCVVMLNIVFRYRGQESEFRSEEAEATEELVETRIDYQYYLYLSAAIITSVFAGTTFICNTVFGRRPSNDAHHNPLYGRFIEGARENLPLGLAIGSSIASFAGGTAFGSRAEQANHVISVVLTTAVVAQRVTAIDYRLYDHAMDRSLLLNGDMRRLEYIAMLGENTIVYVLELIAHGGFLAMTAGATRIQVTDSNRLYWIASIYGATDVAENTLALLMNEYIYYIEIVADRLSPVLLAIGIADPARPVHAVTPRAIDQVDHHVQQIIRAGVEEVEHVAEEVGSFFSNGWASFISIFGSGRQRSHPQHTEQDDRKPSGDEAKEEDQVEERHSGNNVISIFTHYVEELVHPPENGGIVINVVQQANGSYTLNIPPELVDARFNLPENFRFNVPGGNNAHAHLHHYEVREHHWYDSSRTRNLGNNIHSNRVGNGETDIHLGQVTLTIHGRLSEHPEDHAH